MLKPAAPFYQRRIPEPPRKTLYMRPRSLFWRGRLPRRVIPRAAYRNVDSVRYGLHYGGPTGVAFTREVFPATRSVGTGNAYNLPNGVTTFDILAVGAGASGGGIASSNVFFGWNGGGGGGGSVLVVRGVVGFPNMVLLDLIVPAGGVFVSGVGASGAGALVRRGGAPFTVYAQGGQSGGGGGGNGAIGERCSGAAGTANAAVVIGTAAPGSVGGSGGGGGWVDDGAGSIPQGLGGAGAGGGGTGGDSSLNGTTLAVAASNGSGGGGGAGANGVSGIAGSGGAGIIPPDHSYGEWGTDIGENGFFGGGGFGSNIILDVAPPIADTWGSPGVGNGAANTGGGAGVGEGTVWPDAYSGLVAIAYPTP